MEVIKVSARSIPKSVAGAIASKLRENNSVEVQAVGAGAVNQAVKAIAVARAFVAENGGELVCIPYFSEMEVNGDEKTGIRFTVKNLKNDEM